LNIAEEEANINDMAKRGVQQSQFVILTPIYRGKNLRPFTIVQGDS